MVEGRAAMGYDAGVFYLRLALDERYVEECLERIGEDARTRRTSCGASGRRATTATSSWRR